MAASNLTDKAVKAAKPDKHVTRLRDASVPGFHLTISPKGNKSWALAYTSPENGKRRFYSLGSYAESKDAETENCLTLAKARRKATPVRSMVDNEGIDPIEEEKRQEAARVSREAGSFGALLDLYQTMLEEAGRASAGAVQETLSRHVPVTIRAIPAIRITRHHVMDMMEAVIRGTQSTVPVTSRNA